jgi:hypothetical protein
MDERWSPFDKLGAQGSPALEYEESLEAARSMNAKRPTAASASSGLF